MELGYLFYPPQDSHALGHPRLDINLYDSPTGEHIDPYQLDLVIYDPLLGVQHQVFSHPVDRGDYQLCIGRMTIIDFRTHEIEAFSFGGQLSTEIAGDHSYCQITSSAPIFRVTGFNDDETFLASEYEAELARLQALWLNTDQDFCQHLVKYAPLELFHALTNAIDHRLREISSISHNETYLQKLHALHAAIRFSNPDGKLPANAPSINDLIH